MLPRLDMPVNPNASKRSAYSDPIFKPDDWKMTTSTDSYKYRASENQLKFLDTLLTKALEYLKKADDTWEEKQLKEREFFTKLTDSNPQQIPDEDGGLTVENIEDVQNRKKAAFDKIEESDSFADAFETQDLSGDHLLALATLKDTLNYIKDTHLEEIKTQTSEYAMYYERSKSKVARESMAASMADEVVNKLRLDKQVKCI